MDSEGGWRAWYLLGRLNQAWLRGGPQICQPGHRTRLRIDCVATGSDISSLVFPQFYDRTTAGVGGGGVQAGC